MPDPGYEERKDLARVNRNFYQCFEKLDDDAMRELWLDDPAVRCIHPGGEILVGPERIHASWSAIFSHTQKIRLELEDLSVEVHGDIGWVTNVERIRTSTDQGLVTSEAAATNLFVRRDGRWLMILHHASPIARRFFPE